MMNPSIGIRDSDPLQPDYLPSEVVDREEEQSKIENTLFGDGASTDLLLSGKHGTGKTTVARLAAQNSDPLVNTCYVPCTRYDTQYKVLNRVYECVTGENLGSGHHVSELQRKIAERTDQITTIIILDDIDFLLLNDGDDLLYYLSRIEHSSKVGIVAISNNYDDLSSVVEERAYSSFQPIRIQFEEYSLDEVSRVLKLRIRETVEPYLFDEEAVDYIVSTARNPALGLTWLGVTTESQEEVTEQAVERTESEAYSRYIDYLLQDFSIHHRLLYQMVSQLAKGGESVNTGTIYDRYQNLCQQKDVETLSLRRISDFLKHLEYLGLIESEYHYGGNKGKTRTVKLSSV